MPVPERRHVLMGFHSHECPAVHCLDSSGGKEAASRLNGIDQLSGTYGRSSRITKASVCVCVCACTLTLAVTLEWSCSGSDTSGYFTVRWRCGVQGVKLPSSWEFLQSSASEAVRMLTVGGGWKGVLGSCIQTYLNPQCNMEYMILLLKINRTWN